MNLIGESFSALNVHPSLCLTIVTEGIPVTVLIFLCFARARNYQLIRTQNDGWEQQANIVSPFVLKVSQALLTAHIIWIFETNACTTRQNLGVLTLVNNFNNLSWNVNKLNLPRMNNNHLIYIPPEISLDELWYFVMNTYSLPPMNISSKGKIML